MCAYASLYDALPCHPYLAKHDHPGEVRLGQHAGEDPTVRNAGARLNLISILAIEGYPQQTPIHQQS
jgi:hypothetical protein